jgi:nucleotide-binding universal stress UspA family protein
MNILVALDGSQHIKSVVSLTGAIVERSDHRLTALTVIPDHVFLGGHTLTRFLRQSGLPKSELRLADTETVRQHLSDWCNPLATHGFEVHTMVVRGNPADQIIKACREAEADLVILGAKGTSSVSRFLLGTVAQRLMRYAPCSVLIARGTVQKLNRVLVPIDGSDNARGAADFLMQIPLPADTEVHLLSVVESHWDALISTPTLNMTDNAEIVDGLQHAEDRAARSLLAEEWERFHSRGYKVTSTVAYGNPPQQILKAAEDQKVDMIVVGAKGLSGIRGFLLGGVAQRTARYANCAVLIARTRKSRRTDPAR